MQVVGTSDGEASMPMRRDGGGAAAAAAAGVKTRGDAALEVDERHEALYGRDGVWKGALGELEAEKVGEGECNMAIVRRSQRVCLGGRPSPTTHVLLFALGGQRGGARSRARQDKAPPGQTERSGPRGCYMST